MKLETSRFGDIEISGDQVIHFPMGIPGFPDLKRFVIVDYRDPIHWLQAVDNPAVAFIISDPFPFFKDYSLILSDDVEEFLDIRRPSDTLVFTILTVSDNRLMANLKGPVIINTENKRGIQIILDDERYSFRTAVPSIG